jgi:hypothetical protein
MDQGKGIQTTVHVEESWQMSMQDWDYVGGDHPPDCSCEECAGAGLSGMEEGTPDGYTADEPGPGGSSSEETTDSEAGRRPSGSGRNIPNWPKAAAVMAALSIAGIAASMFVGNFIPFALLLAFSIFYCVDRWSGYYTWEHEIVGRVYRLVLNLSLLSLLGLLFWSGVLLFNQRFMQSPLAGSLMFVFEFAVFIWLCRVVSRNGRRQPSMKLTVFSVIGLFLIFSFAGVQPLSAYKDSAFNSILAFFTNANQPDAAVSTSNGIDSQAGKYGDYYLGLVDTPEGYLSGNGCYDDSGDFIVLINNEDAVSPSYFQLVSFLQQDNTDQFPYIYTIGPPGMYYGSAESRVDLERIQNMIDGTAQPADPHVCADFAERLHNNAELAGIRCAYVSVGLAGSEGHACNAFQTTDRGLIYIDCTGISDSYGPDNNDKTVDIQVGEQYDPEYLFPSGGWYIPGGTMGTVTDFQVVWDGTWNN